MPQLAYSSLGVLTRGDSAVSPFVGNGALVGVLTRAARGAALVVGEAGAGKSRLLAEVARCHAATGTDVPAETEARLFSTSPPWASKLWLISSA